ncbi:MAG: Tn3 family transposase [Rickettsiales bacterium]|nr:Tn3 family transposase [Rickettsiales bacterium]
MVSTKFAPRIKDVMSQKLVSFKKIKPELENKGYPITPSYYVKREKIIRNWDTILRLLVTIKLGVHKPSIILKRLNSYAKQHPLYEALKEYGKIIKSIFILEYINDVELRQRIEKQLNKGELANRFASAVSFASDSMSVSYKEDQEIFALCQSIIQNIIILWNYLELTKIIMRSDADAQTSLVSNITNASIITWQHVNMHGTYDFSNLAVANDNDFNYEEIINFKIA